ncbi:MAG: hypothetical protein A2137_07770 [Chloroflexi bacterium RBG_16_58_8]|nr:MAG: hypothetical protein A2137_07770 [Chloroflexi bacterium RBG_16_58_8]
MDHVKAALDNIKRVVEIGKTGWLDEVLADQSKISHPLVANFGASQKAITNGETALNGSHAVIWVMMLARDLQTVLSLIDTKLIAVRLRSPGDVESTKYELFVMAGYYEAGIQVEKTDINKTGEFRIKTGNGYVFIECKHKTAESIRERNIKEIYELGTKELYHLMDRLKKPCIIHITTNTDPKERDLTILMELVEQGLSRDIGSGVRNRRGKYQVLILPSEWGMHSDQSATGVRAPGGYEYAETEAVLREDATGKRIATGTRGIAWYSARPSDWLRSAIDSFRKAAEQLPKNDCGLIYLDLPEGDENILRVRMDMVSKELQRLLTQHQRINVIVLTGLSTVFGYSGPGIATTRVLYKVIYNPRPRLALPSGFKVFGDHFTRKRQ